jgi:transcription factor SOX1/3/14/21 (SOX group B)
MKEHPDYKYRPRRKPKTLVKSPSGGQPNGHHHNGSSNSSSQHGCISSNHDSRSSNQHSHSVKSISPISSQFHPSHHHSATKYPFVSTIELPISFPSPQHTQQQVFPSGIHYPLVDPTLALDLQARLQAMYAGVYYPWRFGCSPLISSSSSPPQNTNIYASSPKISPTTTNSPPLEHDTQTSII